MELREFLTTVFVRRRWTFLVVLAVCVGSAVIVIRGLPDRFEASSLLFVGQDRPISAANTSQRDDVLARSYVELLKAPEVADRAAAKLPWKPSRSDLQASVHFEVKAGTQLIAVTGSDENAERAAMIANTYAEAFVEGRRNVDSSVRRARLEEVVGDSRQVAARLARLRGQAGLGASNQLERNELETQLASLRKTYEALQQSVVLEGRNVTVTSRAATPKNPVAPRPALYLATTLVLGLFFAALAALLRERLDNRGLSEAEVVRIARAPVLAHVPVMRRSNQDAVTEAFAFLRFNLFASESPTIVLVTSASKNDGKTTVVLGLAQELSRAGTAVVAADLDLRVSALSSRTGTKSTVGLIDVAREDASIEDILEPYGSDGLKIAPSGTEDPSQLQQLTVIQAVDLNRKLRSASDVAVLDSAPVGGAVETSVVAAAQPDAVLLVVDPRTAAAEELRTAVAQLAHSGAEVRGVVLNRTETAAYGYGQSRVSRRRRPGRQQRTRDYSSLNT